MRVRVRVARARACVWGMCVWGGDCRVSVGWLVDLTYVLSLRRYQTRHRHNTRHNTDLALVVEGFTCEDCHQRGVLEPFLRHLVELRMIKPHRRVDFLGDTRNIGTTTSKHRNDDIKTSV